MNIDVSKHASSSLPDRVREQMITDIMHGLIRPGEKIVEEVYANKLGVSRAPVREAMSMLVTEGIAEKISKRGTFLKSYSLEDHIDLYSLRFFLEKQALEKLKYIDDLSPLLNDLRELVKNMEVDKPDVNKISMHNYLYHYALIKYSGSRILNEKYPSFYISINFFQQEAYLKAMDEINHPLSDHQHLIEALERRDFDEAKRISDTHHNGVIDLLFSYYQQKKQQG